MPRSRHGTGFITRASVTEGAPRAEEAVDCSAHADDDDEFTGRLVERLRGDGRVRGGRLRAGRAEARAALCAATGDESHAPAPASARRAKERRDGKGEEEEEEEEEAGQAADDVERVHPPVPSAPVRRQIESREAVTGGRGARAAAREKEDDDHDDYDDAGPDDDDNNNNSERNETEQRPEQAEEEQEDEQHAD